MATNPATSESEQFYLALEALGAARAANPFPPSAGKSFELWLMFVMAAIWQRRGWRLELRNGAGAALGPADGFVTRGAPGQIARSHADEAGYIFVETNKPGIPRAHRQFELHGSLQFIGRSAAMHECDIALIPDEVGSIIRARATRLPGTGAPFGLPPAAIECKRHVNAGAVGEMREQVARLFDLTRVINCPPSGYGQLYWEASGSPAPSKWGRRYSAYRDQFYDGYYALARSSGFSSGATLMSAHFNVHAWGNMTLLRVGRLAKAIQTHIAAMSWAKIP